MNVITTLRSVVPRVDYEKLSGNKVSETSDSIRTHVQAARDIQNKRFTNGKATDIVSNADMRIGRSENSVSCRMKVKA